MLCRYHNVGKQNSIVDLQRMQNTNNYMASESIKDLSIHQASESMKDLSALQAFDSSEALSHLEYTAIAPANAPVVLSFENLVVKTIPKHATNFVSTNILNKPPTATIKLLKSVSGTITGGLWAIMGPSGSGKTTLLCALSLRLDLNRMTQSGEIHMNGKPYGTHLLKGMSGFVMQDDLLHAHLTVHEVLWYAAALRMSHGSTVADRKARVDDVLKTMGINYTRNVIVGDTRNKGISGGERKRVCIAMELLTKPSLLFLDEPTSGLDSATALSVCGTLKKLARRGECTVITTIHQPQTKIWEMMDNLLLLVAGEIVYQGLCSKAVDYYASLGYPCPDRSNPADHIMDVIAKRYKRDAPKTDLKQGSKDTSITANAEGGIPLEPDTIHLEDDDHHKEKFVHNPADDKTIAAFQHPPINLDFGVEKDDFTLRAVIPWFYQFSILFIRCSQEWFRRWDVIVINACVATLIGAFVGYGPWNNIGTSQTGVAKYTPILFFCVIHQGVIASLQGCFSFPLERALMIRERSAGTYYVSAYFLAKSLADMAVQSIPPIVYSLVVYPNCGFKEYSDRFGGFLLFNLLNTLACVSMTTFISCLCVTIERTTVIIACYLEVARLYSNFFMSPALMRDYPTWQWISNISHMKYAFIGLVLNQYTDMKFYCKPKELVNGKCPTTNGNQVIARNEYDMYDRDDQFWQYILFIIVARFAGYLCIRFIKA